MMKNLVFPVVGATYTIAGLVLGASARGDDASAVRILEAHCVRCHGGASTKGGLSLATAEGLRRGGASGPAVEPGKPDESPLIEKVTGAAPEMPRGGQPLTAEEVAALRHWIAQGASWPAGLVLREPDSAWWAIQPLRQPEPPPVEGTERVHTEIDRFVLAALEAKGLTFRPEAEPRTLIRRLTFDLTGLPPTPEEVDAFVAAALRNRHAAVEQAVDRLLASPRYGERWGRHWLDVVHYGDTHGYDKDKRRPNGWPYRDYVVRAFNQDTPYGRFVAEQVAGDVLFPDDPWAVIATGFVAAGPWDFVGHVELREGTVEKEKTRLIDRDDMLANTMSSFVSLTVHCARCHDHKFDPISQRDYYRLQAVFAGVERGDRPHGAPSWHGDGIGPPTPAPLVYALVSRRPRPIHVLARGDVEHPGELVGPGALACVPGPNSRFPETDDEGERRAALARWLSDRANPLTWRSIVNRIWQYHFGQGLVATPNDFGRNGAVPTHPELLDWLAARLRDDPEQSLKRLHREILRSAVYRQSSELDAGAEQSDADNRLLWRQHRRRLEAEAIRDAMLFVAGRLDSRMGGPGFDLFRYKDDHSPTYDHDDPAWIDPPTGRRRTIYRFVVRSVPNPWIECLDGADPNTNVPVRNTTITAPQALMLLNDPFVLAQAEALAERVAACRGTIAEQVEGAFTLALGRPPRPTERAVLVEHATRFGLASTCRVLFNLNEFVFVD